MPCDTYPTPRCSAADGVEAVINVAIGRSVIDRYERAGVTRGGVAYNRTAAHAIFVLVGIQGIFLREFVWGKRWPCGTTSLRATEPSGGVAASAMFVCVPYLVGGCEFWLI